MSDDIMTVAQAAEYLKVCDKTIRRLISKKQLEASQVGKTWRIKKSEIDRYLIENSNCANRSDL